MNLRFELANFLLSGLLSVNSLPASSVFHIAVILGPFQFSVQLLDLLVKHLVLFQRINDREVAVLIVEASRILPTPDLKSDLIEILAQSNAARGISTTRIRFAVEPIQAAIVIGEPNKLFHFAATENVLRSANVLRLGAQTVCRYFLQKFLCGFYAVILACHIAVSFSL